MIVRHKEIEAENTRLEKMYAEEKLKTEIVRKALEKVAKPARRREIVIRAVAERSLKIRTGCRALGISERCYHREAKLSDENAKNSPMTTPVDAMATQLGIQFMLFVSA